ncbi:MAG: HAD-IC family P-type ATPase, partial [Longicatena sp.]
MAHEHIMDIDLQCGLTQSQIDDRIQKGQVNVQSETITKSYKEIFRDNLLTLFNLINAILAGLIIFIGSFRNILFLGVVISNIFIGIIQEIRAKRVLDKLSLITQFNIRVLRDCALVEIHMNELVLDDIMILSTGNQICADAIVLEGRLEVNESLVTGESDIIIKHVGDELYSGSFITSGNAKCQVLHVGKDNYAERIMCDAKRLTKHKSQLRDSINFIIKTIGIIIIPVGVLLFSKQLFITGATFPEAIVSTVAALLGMVPEGLVLLTSVALAVGSINLAKHNTLVQELYCIETLARVDTLCLDKTGTITEGNMQVEDLIPLHGELAELKQILANLCFSIQDENSTSLAISSYLKEMKTTQQASSILPFSSARKYSAATFGEQGTYSMGAYEFMQDSTDSHIIEMINIQANLGNRVLGVAHNEHPIK